MEGLQSSFCLCLQTISTKILYLACKAGGFAGGMIRKQRLRTTGRHFERANKGETGERKKEKGRGWGRGKRREEGGGSGGSHPPPHPLPSPSLFTFFLSPVSPLFARSKWWPVVRNRCFRIIPPAKPPALQAILYCKLSLCNKLKCIFNQN